MAKSVRVLPSEVICSSNIKRPSTMMAHPTIHGSVRMEGSHSSRKLYLGGSLGTLRQLLTTKSKAFLDPHQTLPAFQHRWCFHCLASSPNSCHTTYPSTQSSTVEQESSSDGPQPLSTAVMESVFVCVCSSVCFVPLP